MRINSRPDSFRNLIRSLILMGLLAIFLVPAAQTPDSLNLNTIEGMNKLRQMQQDPFTRVYNQARSLRDYPSAIYALHHLLLVDPENSYLQDTLALLYVKTGNTTSCLAWINQCLESRPESVYLLNLSANLLESKGDYPAALARYEGLHKMTRSHFYRYKEATLQFLLGRHGECLANIEAMLQDSAVARELVEVSWDERTMDVPMPAALLNLRGNLELALNRSGKARKSFRQSLKMAPDFDLPRNNLRAMDERDRERREQNDR